jgi:hypothetical protein
MWEIKPQEEEADGMAEVIARINIMNLAKELRLLRGSNHPIHGAYDWNTFPSSWFQGLTLWQTPIFLGTEPAGWMSFYAQQTLPGVVIWWKVKNSRRQPSPYPILAPADIVWTHRNRRPAHPPQVYEPGRGVVPNPAYAMVQANMSTQGQDNVPASEPYYTEWTICNILNGSLCDASWITNLFINAGIGLAAGFILSRGPGGRYTYANE